MKKHTEARFEDAIVAELCEDGGYEFVDYNRGDNEGKFDRSRALDASRVLGFITGTQPKPWGSLKAIHGDDAVRS